MENSKEVTNNPLYLDNLPYDVILKIMGSSLPNQLLGMPQGSKILAGFFDGLKDYLRELGISLDDAKKNLAEPSKKLSLGDLAKPKSYLLVVLQEYETIYAKTLDKPEKSAIRILVCDILFCLRFDKPQLLSLLKMPDALSPKGVTYLLQLLELVQTDVYLGLPKDKQQPFLDELYNVFETFLRPLRERQNQSQLLRLIALCNQEPALLPKELASQPALVPETQELLESMLSRHWGRNATENLQQLRHFIKNADPADWSFCLYALQRNKQFSSAPDTLKKANLADKNLEGLLRDCFTRGYYAPMVYILQNFPYPNPEDNRYIIGFISSVDFQSCLLTRTLMQANAAFSVFSECISIDLSRDDLPNSNYQQRQEICKWLLCNPGLDAFSQKHPAFWQTEFGGLTPAYMLVNWLAMQKTSSETQPQHQILLQVLRRLAATRPELFLQSRFLLKNGKNMLHNQSAVEALMDKCVNYKLGTNVLGSKPSQTIEQYLDTLNTLLQSLQIQPGIQPICRAENMVCFLSSMDRLYDNVIYKNAGLYQKRLQICISLLDSLSASDRTACFARLSTQPNQSKNMVDMFNFLQKAYKKIDLAQKSQTGSLFGNKKTPKKLENYRALLNELKKNAPEQGGIQILCQDIKKASQDKHAGETLDRVMALSGYKISQPSRSSSSTSGPSPK